MNPELIQGKIKIIQANIKLLEKFLLIEENEKTQNTLLYEKRELEKLKDTNPEFFI